MIKFIQMFCGPMKPTLVLVGFGMGAEWSYLSSLPKVMSYFSS